MHCLYPLTKYEQINCLKPTLFEDYTVCKFLIGLNDMYYREVLKTSYRYRF